MIFNAFIFQISLISKIVKLVVTILRIGETDGRGPERSLVICPTFIDRSNLEEKMRSSHGGMACYYVEVPAKTKINNLTFCGSEIRMHVIPGCCGQFEILTRSAQMS